jgi:hypothetical protein
VKTSFLILAFLPDPPPLLENDPSNFDIEAPGGKGVKARVMGSRFPLNAHPGRFLGAISRSFAQM